MTVAPAAEVPAVPEASASTSRGAKAGAAASEVQEEPAPRATSRKTGMESETTQDTEI